MKIRNGFVSNSSSSSFIIDARKYNIEQIIIYIEKLIDAESFIDFDSFDFTRDDICTISLLNFNNTQKIFEEYSQRFKCLYPHELKEFTKDNVIDFPKGAIVVDSIYDNSIPWIIQNALGKLGLRIHWG